MIGSSGMSVPIRIDECITVTKWQFIGKTNVVSLYPAHG
jgi:hypothetical protein